MKAKETMMPVMISPEEITALRSVLERLLNGTEGEAARFFEVLDSVEQDWSHKRILDSVAAAAGFTTVDAANLMMAYDLFSSPGEEGEEEEEEEACGRLVDFLRESPDGKKLVDSARGEIERFARRSVSYQLWEKAKAVRAGLLPRMSNLKVQVQARPLMDLERGKIVNHILSAVLRLSYVDGNYDDHETVVELSPSEVDSVLEELELAKNKFEVLRREYSEKTVE